MGITSFDTEFTFSIPAAEVFQALAITNHLIPRGLLPILRSAELVEETTSRNGDRKRTVKHKVEVLNNEFSYQYSIAEGDDLGTIFEKTSNEVKIMASSGGGSVCKSKSRCFTEDNAGITGEKIMAMKEKAAALFLAIEAFLVANPRG